MKLYFFILSSFCILSSSVTAITYQTHFSGMWSNNNVWQNGIAPSSTSSDTIIIKNFIEFDSTLTFLQNAYVRVDSTGALCGHDTIIFNSGTKMDVYGTLECDVFNVPGGTIEFYYSANIIWSQYAHLTNGAYLHSNGSINTGPWFNCLSKGNGIDENEYPVLIFKYENASGFLSIEGSLDPQCSVTDMAGKSVLNTKSNFLYLGELSSGVYIVTAKCNEGICRRKIYLK